METIIGKICGPTTGCGRLMPLDARFCPYCGAPQIGAAPVSYPLHGMPVAYTVPMVPGTTIVIPFPSTSAAPNGGNCSSIGTPTGMNTPLRIAGVT